MEKLFVYGTLRPGEPNEYLLKKIGGSWKKGYVWGKLFAEGWGANMGYPGVRLEDKIEQVKGYVFYSDRLGEYWEELDDFEGPAYQRIKTTVILAEEDEEVEAFIYAIK